MADLDFSHKVSEVPKGADLPRYQGEGVKAQVAQYPDVGAAVAKFGSDTNWMSQLGSEVATRASNAIATQLGGNKGKNPTGDLMPPITDFDAAFNKSYQAQAHATLGLQANKLITDANLELAKSPRISADMIAKTNQTVSIGLQNIFQNAPAEIRPTLEYQFGAQQLSQTSELTRRMITEQRADQKDNADAATRLSSQNTHSLEINGIDLDKDGNSKAALREVENVRKQQRALLGMHNTSKSEADAAIDGAEISRLSGKYTRIALNAEREGKLHEANKNLADNKEIPDKYRPAVLQNVSHYMEMQEHLRSQDQNLQSQLMHNRIAAGDLPTDSEWANFANNVGPLKAAEMRFKLIQAQNKTQTEGVGVSELIKNYGDAATQASAEPKIKNAAFTNNVNYTIQQNPVISRDQAEVQVASSAGAPAPVFTKTLHNGLWSGDPAQMVQRAKQIDELQNSGNGHALSDLSPQDLALADDIAISNNPADPAWAARVLTENKENMDQNLRQLSGNVFDNMVTDNTRKNNTSVDDWVLDKFGLKNGLFSAGFDSSWLQGKYASEILSMYRTNFINARRDDVRATARTQEEINNKFGKTKFNGPSEWSKYPIEKACGFNTGDGIPSINKDLIRQTAEPMQKLKELYNDNKSDFYWAIESRTASGEKKIEVSKDALKRNLASYITEDKSEGLYFVKHTRSGVGTKTERFPLKLVGNNFNYELNVETDHGTMSVFLHAPEIGVHKYTPDVEWIRNDYMGHYQNFPYGKYVPELNKQLSPNTEGLDNG